jgi:apolipoprotein N-acyltransferase
MANWPKTVSGNLLIVLFTIAFAPVLVWAAVIMSGPLVWASLIVVGLVIVGVFIRRRRVDAARERAWVGAFSFGDVVRRRHAKEALDVSGA